MSNEEKQTKKENPQETNFPLIEIEVVKSDLKKVLSAHKRFAIQGKDVEGSNLSWINFKVSGDELSLRTTNGTQALVSKLQIISNYGNDGEFNLSMALVAKISFIKGLFDEIRIATKKDTVEFIDNEYNSTQKLTMKTGEVYPKIDKLIPQKRNFKISVSQKLIKDIASLKAPLGYIEILLDTNNPLAPILVETNSENLQQQALLLPASKEEEKEKNK